jgi:hypothetical protein
MKASTSPALNVPALGVQLPLVLTVEYAGQLAGWNRDLAYRAAKNGALPVLRVGARLFVPTATWLAQLGLEALPLTTTPAVAS